MTWYGSLLSVPLGKPGASHCTMLFSTLTAPTTSAALGPAGTSCNHREDAVTMVWGSTCASSTCESNVFGGQSGHFKRIFT